MSMMHTLIRIKYKYREKCGNKGSSCSIQ